MPNDEAIESVRRTAAGMPQEAAATYMYTAAKEQLENNSNWLPNDIFDILIEASALGNPDASECLGRIYGTGWGDYIALKGIIAKSDSQSMHYFNLASVGYLALGERGDRRYLHEYCVMVLAGFFSGSPEWAVSKLHELGEQGFAGSCHQLALMYSMGYCVEYNPETAEYYFQKYAALRNQE